MPIVQEYVPDTFNNTGKPNFSTRSYEPNDGIADGGLRVFLGPGRTGGATSGGWSQEFSIGQDGSAQVTLSFRLRNITNQGFEFCMQEQELNPKEHLMETVDYIAWQSSTGSLNGYSFEVSKTANKVKDSFYTIEFGLPFESEPFFLADMQTTDGRDTASVRWQNKNNLSVEIKIDEEQSKNSETGHTTEVVGYMVFAK